MLKKTTRGMTAGMTRRGVGFAVAGGGPTFSPADLTGLELWLDASDSGTITLNGSSVSQWDDKSGNDRHATQASASLQPTYLSNVVSFDGTELMALPGNILSLNAASAFIVGKYSSGVGQANGYLLFANGNGTDERFYCASADSSFASFVWTVEVSVPFEQDAVNTNTNIFGLTHGSNTASAYRNAVLLSTATRNKTDSIDNFFLGAANGTTPRLNGEINEIVLLSNVPPTEDRQKLEGYLAWKWSIESSLPAGHPYESSPPA